MAPWKKILSFFFIVLYWLALYCYALHFPPVCVPERLTNILLQTSNSLALFLMMVSGFVVFSSSIQKTERQLMIANQELSAAASTDPLTQLPNRRAMLERIENYLKESESRRFSVAIADIDFFKKVNDTYGHDCGDYTLRSLSDLFRREAGEDYWVCRWGGEEFCIFLPGKNLDVAGEILFRLVNTVRKMKLSYNSVSFSITITAGVAENDFVSPLSAILKEADDKLYQGKMNGRDQVVI